MESEVLAQQIAAHQLWLDSRHMDGKQAVFRGRNLRFADLAGARLNECMLAESNLERANLKGALLAGADLRKVNFAYADLSGADLSGANLSGAQFEGAVADNATFRDALLEDTIFDSAMLRSANLTAAHGARAKFRRADVSFATLDAAHLQDAEFNGANLTQASMRETNLDRARLSGAVMSGAQVDGASFRDALLLKTLLVGVSFETSNIEGARIDRDAVAGAAHEADDERATDAPRKDMSLFSGMTLKENAEMSRLLRQRDALHQHLRHAALDAHQDHPTPEAEEEFRSLRAEIEKIENDRRVLRLELRRQEEHRRLTQSELQNRVDAAARALRHALQSTNQQLKQANAWGAVAKTSAYAAMLAGAVWPFIYFFAAEQALRLPGYTWATVSGVLLLTGIAFLVADHANRRNMRPLIDRRNRIENVTAALSAASSLSFDVETNQANLLATFERASQVLMGTPSAGYSTELS